jgi:N-acetyl-anhydromuramyl-L-alanine amidase AmpD
VVFYTSLAMLLINALVAGLAGRLSAASPAAGATNANTGAPGRSSAAAIVLDAAPPERDWKTIVMHHSATRGGDVATIDAEHRKHRDRSGNPWLGIGYHFVVGNGQKMADGEVQATFRWHKQLPGAHAGNRDHNDNGIGICLIGNFDQAPPTDRQVAAARGLVKALADRYSITRDGLVRHSDVHATLCPGKLFPWEPLRSELAAGQPTLDEQNWKN